MTPEATKIRSDAIAQAIEYGYTLAHPDDVPTDLHAPPGKFEGEPFYALYFYDAIMDGGCDDSLYFGTDTVQADICEVSDAERGAFELSPRTTHVALWNSDSGFVTLEELTYKRYCKLLAEDDAANEANEESI